MTKKTILIERGMVDCHKVAWEGLEVASMPSRREMKWQFQSSLGNSSAGPASRFEMAITAPFR